jgi:hypothetical protein
VHVDVEENPELRGCDDEKIKECPICCRGFPAVCTNDALHCPILRNQDFSILSMCLNIILIFGVGLPLSLFILDILILWRPCGLNKSCCECLLSCFCYCCIRQNKA